MSWDPCSFQISGKVCTCSDSRPPTSIHRLQKHCFLPTMPHQRTKERKRTQGRIFDWTHPEWSYTVMQTCLVKRLRINMDPLYIRESLSNLMTDGRATSFEAVELAPLREFLHSWLVPRFHTRIAPLSPPKSIHGARTWFRLWLNVHEPDISSFSGVPRQVGKTGCKVILHDLHWFAKLGAVTVENFRVERFRFGQDDFSPKCTKSCALTRACPPVDLSTFKRSLLEM